MHSATWRVLGLSLFGSLLGGCHDHIDLDPLDERHLESGDRLQLQGDVGAGKTIVAALAACHEAASYD